MVIWPYKEVKKVDAVEFLKGYDRMCKSSDSCMNCCLHCGNNGTGRACSVYIRKCPEKAVQIVEQWTEEHKNTRQKEFLKIYPNVDKSYGIINMIPCILDTTYKEKYCNKYTSCEECRKDYWLKEVDKNNKKF